MTLPAMNLAEHLALALKLSSLRREQTAQNEELTIQSEIANNQATQLRELTTAHTTQLELLKNQHAEQLVLLKTKQKEAVTAHASSVEGVLHVNNFELQKIKTRALEHRLSAITLCSTHYPKKGWLMTRLQKANFTELDLIEVIHTLATDFESVCSREESSKYGNIYQRLDQINTAEDLESPHSKQWAALLEAAQAKDSEERSQTAKC